MDLEYRAVIINELYGPLLDDLADGTWGISNNTWLRAWGRPTANGSTEAVIVHTNTLTAEAVQTLREGKWRIMPETEVRVFERSKPTETVAEAEV